MNLLVVGRGSIGQKHESNAVRLGVNVVTADPNKSARADCADAESAVLRYGCGYFTQAIIATPADTHLSILKMLLQYGVPRIFVEKPLATPDELSLAKALAEHGLSSTRVYVGFNWRFNSAVLRMKQMISTDKIGGVQVAQLSAREWLPNYGGNVLIESGSHILDTARYLFGELKVLGAHMTNHTRFGDNDEAASILLTNQEGANIYVHVNFVNTAGYDYRILVQGRKGTQACQPDRLEPMHLLELEAFLRGDDSILATFDDGIRNLHLLQDTLENDSAFICR